MNFRVSEIFPASSVNDAVLVENFTEENDALVLARGNKLLIYIVEDGYISEPKVFNIFGEIERVIPVRYSRSMQSNVLLILKDLRVAILKYDDQTTEILTTVSAGTLEHTWDASRVPIKYAIHPTCIIIQFEQFQLDVFPITSNCTIDDPFQIRVGHKKIINFQFVGPTSKVTRLTVLTEEFQKPPCLHLFDIDSSNRSYSEDTTFSVTIADAYFQIPYDPETHSITIVFTSEKAIRLMYNELVPVTKSATVFTKDPLVHMVPLNPELYIAVDTQNNLFVASIEEEGPIRFVKIGKAPNPSVIAIISEHLVFIGSKNDDSVILSIHNENNSYNASVFDTFKSTGKIINYKKIDSSIVSIYERAIVESQIIYEYLPTLKIECSNFTHVNCFYMESKEIRCYALSNNEETKIFSRNLEEEVNDITEMFNADSPTLNFYELGGDKFIQVTKTKIILYHSDTEVQSLTFQKNTEAFYTTQFQTSIAVALSNNSVNTYIISNNGDEIQFKGNLTFTEIISSIALTTNLIAVSFITKNSISVYNLQDNKLVNSFETKESVIDVAFHENTLFVLSPVDTVTLIQPNFNIIKKLEIKGHHTHMKILNENCIAICGSDPAIIKHKSVYPLKYNQGKMLDISILDDEVIVLNLETLFIGKLNGPFYSSKSYSSKFPIIDIIPLNNIFLIVRLNSNNEIVIYSSDDAHGKSFLQEVVKLKSSDKYIGYYIFQNIIYFATSMKIRKYIYTNDEFQKLENISVQDEIIKIDKFRDYMFIQFSNEIRLYQNLMNGDENLQENSIPPISENGKIYYSAVSNNIIAFVSNQYFVKIYFFDDFNERFVQFSPSYQSQEAITSIGILDETVIISTENGNIYSLDLLETDNVPKYDIVLQSCFCTDNNIINITSISDGSLMMGLENGASYRIEEFKKRHSRFNELYQFLQKKVTSAGSFRNDYQRSAKCGRFLRPLSQLPDFDLIRIFKSKTRAEQEDILLGSSFTVDLANEILELEET